MSKNFQHEVPPARINITLDVETHGAMQSKELPCKLLLIAKLSNYHSNESIKHRQRLSINKENFDAVLAQYKPSLKYSVTNLINQSEPRLNLDLQFKAFDDFSPEKLIQQIPELKQLLSMRHLLKDLKANLLDKRQAWQVLQNTLADKDSIGELQQEIQDSTDK